MNTYKHNGSKTKLLFIISLLLAIAAVFVTILLIMAHYETANVGSFCNINDFWNCDRVNKSIYSEMFGIPVSILGFLYYSFLTAFFFVTVKKIDISKFFKLDFFLNLTFIVAAISAFFIFYLQIFQIPSFLPYLIIKLVIFLISYYFLFNKGKKEQNLNLKTKYFIALFTLFGVSFSLYLSDIEFFVLHAFCIYCLTQQLLITTIFIISLISLKLNDNDQSTDGESIGKAK